MASNLREYKGSPASVIVIDGEKPLFVELLLLVLLIDDIDVGNRVQRRYKQVKRQRVKGEKSEKRMSPSHRFVSHIRQKVNREGDKNRRLKTCCNGAALFFSHEISAHSGSFLRLGLLETPAYIGIARLQ